MLRNLSILTAIMLLTACAAIDDQQKREDSHFRPARDSFTFTYKQSPGSLKGEEDRWLSQYLSDNNMCKHGYILTNHQKVIVGKNFVGTFYEHTYTGKCKKKG